MQSRSHFTLHPNIICMIKGAGYALLDVYAFFSLIVGVSLVLHASLPDVIGIRNAILLFGLFGALHIMYEIDYKIIRKTQNKLIILKDIQTLSFLLVKFLLIINLIFFGVFQSAFRAF